MDYIFRLCKCGLPYFEAWEIYTAHVSRCDLKGLEKFVSTLEEGSAKDVGAVRA